MEYLNLRVPNVTLEMIGENNVAKSFKIECVAKFMDEKYGKDERVLLIKYVVDNTDLDNLLNYKNDKIISIPFKITLENYIENHWHEIIDCNKETIENMYLCRDFKTRITDGSSTDRVLVFSNVIGSYKNVNRIIDREQNEQLNNAIRSKRDANLYVIENCIEKLSKSSDKIALALKGIENKLNKDIK